ncbi:MAG: NAD-glutamate dehydrogenase domain-containing protein [Rhizomicrobium sp.]
MRVNGGEIRAKVIGEGANLGVTQQGRIEYARAGGRINTDAIDNSAGVDTSDHEVNLKILLGGPPAAPAELTPRARDELLNAMTDDVAAHVLKDNYDQTLALSVAQGRAVRDLDAHGRYMRDLERRGRLDRAVEFLPSDSELQKLENETKGLTRPELAVLLAYAKLDLDAEIVASDLPDDPAFAAVLAGYFPPAAVKQFPDALEQHRLRREIVSTSLVNRLVNLAGPVFVARHDGDVGRARRPCRARLRGGGGRLRPRRAQGPHRCPRRQGRRRGADRDVHRRLGNPAPAGPVVHHQRPGERRSRLDHRALPCRRREPARHLQHARLGLRSERHGRQHQAPHRCGRAAGRGGGRRRAAADERRTGDRATRAQPFAQPRPRRGRLFRDGRYNWRRPAARLAARISATEHWDRLAIRRIVDDLFAGQRALTAEALEGAAAQGSRADGSDAVKTWAQARGETLERARSFLDALERSGDLSIAKLTLANSQIRELAAR